MDNNNVSVDFNALLTEFKNMALNKIISGFIETDEQKKYIHSGLQIFNNHGISTETAIEVFQEMSKLEQPKGDSEE